MCLLLDSINTVAASATMRRTYLASSQSCTVSRARNANSLPGRLQRRKPIKARVRNAVLNAGEAAARETAHKNGGASRIKREDADGQDGACTGRGGKRLLQPAPFKDWP